MVNQLRDGPPSLSEIFIKFFWMVINTRKKILKKIQKKKCVRECVSQLQVPFTTRCVLVERWWKVRFLNFGRKYKLGFKFVCVRVATRCRENVSQVNSVKSREVNVFFQTRGGYECLLIKLQGRWVQFVLNIIITSKRKASYFNYINHTQ